MHYYKVIIVSEGAFMLYNYARLCSIFDHFEQCVQQGDVAPLPPAEDVDFSLLKHDVSSLHITPITVIKNSLSSFFWQLFTCSSRVVTQDETKCPFLGSAAWLVSIA